jgi:tetratricopeptide (TPR) repeat protein
MSVTTVTPSRPIAGETRLVFRGVNYAVYEALVEALSEPPSIRMAFDGEDLEIMVPGGPHERFKKLLAAIVSVISEELEIPRAYQGSTTWKGLQLGRGLESDECYYFNPEKLRTAATEAIRLDANEPRGYHNRGMTCYLAKEYDKAIADFSEAIRGDPKSARFFNHRGMARYLKKEYDEALADYSEALRIDLRYSAAFHNRGLTWRRKQKYDEAIADFSLAVRLDPKDSQSLHRRGQSWSAKRVYDKAIADFSEAIRLDPASALAFSGRAWLWATCPDAKFRDGKKAVGSVTRACELSEWKEAYNLGTQAAACAETGQFDKAIEWQEKANKLYSNSEDTEKGEARLKLYKKKKPYRED